MLIRRFHSLLIFVLYLFIIEKVIDGDVKTGSFAVLIGTMFKFDGQVMLIFTSVFQMANGCVSGCGRVAVGGLAVLNCVRTGYSVAETVCQVLLDLILVQNDEFGDSSHGTRAAITTEPTSSILDR